MSKNTKKDSITAARADKVHEQAAGSGESLIPAAPPEQASAEAMLKAAVTSAKERAGDKVAEPRAEPTPAGRIPASRPSMLQAAGFALVLGLGWVGGWATFVAAESPGATLAQKSVAAVDWSALAAGLQQSQADALRLSGDVRTLKGGVDALKEAIDKAKQDTATKLVQLERPKGADPEALAKLASLAERLERAQRSDEDALGKLVKATESLERSEAVERETAARLVQVVERLDRIERQARPTTVAAPASAPAAPAAPIAAATEGPAHTGTIEPKATPKPPIVEGWILRDVYNGLALVEGKNQRLVEIGPGDNLPGVGRVEAIERRGKSWVVLTAKGVISSQQW